MSVSGHPCFSLGGKSIAVIGASGGIGSACGSAVAALGANVVASGRDRARLEVFGGLVPDARLVVLDLENLAMCKRELAGWPELDGLVVASGINAIKPLRAQSEEEFQRVMRVNFEAPAFLVRELLRLRKFRDGASLVFVGSIAGRVGAAGHVAYSASKAALAGMVRSLALEVASRKIRVNTISPGLVETEMAADLRRVLTPEQAMRYADSYPLGVGSPADVAGAVCFLLSPASRWITGTDLVVDGGNTHA